MQFAHTIRIASRLGHPFYRRIEPELVVISKSICWLAKTDIATSYGTKAGNVTPSCTVYHAYLVRVATDNGVYHTWLLAIAPGLPAIETNIDWYYIRPCETYHVCDGLKRREATNVGLPRVRALDITRSRAWLPRPTMLVVVEVVAVVRLVVVRLAVVEA